jgi:site-specific DNA recombinase
MEPDAVAAFVKDHAELSNSQTAERVQDRARLESERAATKRKLEGLYDAISEGLRSLGLQDKLLAMEGRIAAIGAELAGPAPTPVRLNPNLSELYRRKVTELALTLADPAIASPAREVVSGLIEKASLRWEEGQPVVVLDGTDSLVRPCRSRRGPRVLRGFVVLI